MPIMGLGVRRVLKRIDIPLQSEIITGSLRREICLLRKGKKRLLPQVAEEGSGVSNDSNVSDYSDSN